MQHTRTLSDINLQNSWVTIGSFDGVHLGHQEILRGLTAGAHAVGAPAVVLTFFPHPAIVLGKRRDPYYLTSPDEKASLLGRLGIDVIITLPFTLEIAELPAEEFIARLKKHLDMRHLWVGHDFALGRRRQGNENALQHLGAYYGYALHSVDPIRVDGQVVSSSLVRAALNTGEVAAAAKLLGRPYNISGEIIHGDGRGKPLGIPTANLDLWPERALPKAGVYVCRAELEGQTWGAVTNIGVRPTFENQPVPPRVETHLLNFDRDLYGKELALEFITRLRDELRFPNPQALLAQIQADISSARQVLNN